MSCANKTFPIIGRKMLSVTPLATQTIAIDDSVLGGSLRQVDRTGLTKRYGKMIRQAFDKKFYSLGGTKYTIAPDGTLTSGSGFRQIEQNFSMFWEIAIMLYEATLISPDTKFAQSIGCELESCSEQIAPVVGLLTASEERGQGIFLNEGKCVNCHKGPDFTGAGVTLQGEDEEGDLVERMIMADEENGPALYDNGFYNISVRQLRKTVAVVVRIPGALRCPGAVSSSCPFLLARLKSQCSGSKAASICSKSILASSRSCSTDRQQSPATRSSQVIVCPAIVTQLMVASRLLPCSMSL